MSVTISEKRYIELLEMESAELKRQLTGKRSVKMGCSRTAITEKIRASGTTLKQWAADHGFTQALVRKFVCGARYAPAVRDALIADGFLEEEDNETT